MAIIPPRSLEFVVRMEHVMTLRRSIVVVSYPDPDSQQLRMNYITSGYEIEPVPY